MRNRLAWISAALALISGAASTAQTPAPPWEVVKSGEVCGAMRWPVALGSAAPDEYALIVAGAPAELAGPQSVKVDGKPLLLTFRPLTEGIGADLDSAALGAIAAGQRLAADWPKDEPLDVPLDGVSTALRDLHSCAFNVAQAKAKALAAAKPQGGTETGGRLRRGLEILGAAAAVMGSSSGGSSGGWDSGFGSGGMSVTCTKRGESRAGMDRHCVYNCGGRERVMTVGPAQLCPLTAEFNL